MSYIRRLFHFFSRSAPVSNPAHLMRHQVLQAHHGQRFPSWKQWKQLPSLLTSSERRLVRVAWIVFFLSAIGIGGGYLFLHQTVVPRVGGEYVEGIVGEPSLVNPLYAVSDVDKDLVRLVYSGLFKWGQNGKLEGDLADHFAISEDQKTYTVFLKEQNRWHSGTPVTSDDIVFTLQHIQDPAFRSPFANRFQGITAHAIDPKTIEFQLQKPTASFLSLLTIGILPKDLWSGILPQNAPFAPLNRQPIGSGPYKFEKMTIDKKGSIHSFTLVRHETYQPAPDMEHITLIFYSSFDLALNDFEKRHIDGLGSIPLDRLDDVKKRRDIHLAFPVFPHTTGVFFNTDRNPVLKDPVVREAMTLAIDKNTLMDRVLIGHGLVLNGPLPSPFLTDQGPSTAADPEKAARMLEEAGYKIEEGSPIRIKKGKTSSSPLSFELTTIDKPLFVATATFLKEELGKIGVEISIKTLPAESLYTQAVKPRAYDMLLTTLQFGSDGDPSIFWGSSQKTDPGFNVANFANADADKLLVSIQSTTKTEDRQTLYANFETLVQKQFPALFLFQQPFVYAVANSIHSNTLPFLSVPADRFNTISSWYIKTKRILR